MKHIRRTGAAACMAMLIMILDTKTAISGAREGLQLCLATVIPSLFPFFVLSILLTTSLVGTRSRFLAPLGNLLGIPSGSESLFLIGLLGGYPTGAQAVADACRDGALDRSDGKRMLGFCSNAGPSFLFGIAAAHFTSPLAAWVLWGIHILSALVVGILLPGKSRGTASPKAATVTLTEAMERGIRAMARVCGWIILFRVVLAFCNRWFLWALDTELQITANGIAELTIGCTALSRIENEGLRFIVCAGLLGFGGLCVAMQTASVTGSLGMGMYLPGKVLQCAISVLAASILQQFLFTGDQQCAVHPLVYLLGIFIPAVALIFSQKRKNRCSNQAAVGV